MASAAYGVEMASPVQGYMCTFGCVDFILPTEPETIWQHFLQYHPNMPQNVVQRCPKGCIQILLRTAECEQAHDIAAHSNEVRERAVESEGSNIPASSQPNGQVGSPEFEHITHATTVSGRVQEVERVHEAAIDSNIHEDSLPEPLRLRRSPELHPRENFIQESPEVDSLQLEAYSNVRPKHTQRSERATQTAIPRFPGVPDMRTDKMFDEEGITNWNQLTQPPSQMRPNMGFEEESFISQSRSGGEAVEHMHMGQEINLGQQQTTQLGFTASVNNNKPMSLSNADKRNARKARKGGTAAQAAVGSSCPIDPTCKVRFGNTYAALSRHHTKYHKGVKFSVKDHIVARDGQPEKIACPVPGNCGKMVKAIGKALSDHRWGYHRDVKWSAAQFMRTYQKGEQSNQ